MKELSCAELGHFNFREKTEVTMLTICTYVKKLQISTPTNQIFKFYASIMILINFKVIFMNVRQ